MFDIPKTIREFKEMVGKDIFIITYLTKGGKERKAVGSLMTEFVPRENVPKNTSHKRTGDNYINYFDMERMAWRKFNIERLIIIHSICPTKRANEVPDENGKGKLNHKDHQKLRIFEAMEAIRAERLVLSRKILTSMTVFADDVAQRRKELTKEMRKLRKEMNTLEK